MLILARHLNERIHFEVNGVEFEVVVVEIGRWQGTGKKRVRLGIDAPPQVIVKRNELLDRQPAPQSTEGVS